MKTGLQHLSIKDTREFFQERNSEGVPIKGTGARYVVTVITRVCDITGKKEFYLAKEH